MLDLWAVRVQRLQPRILIRYQKVWRARRRDLSALVAWCKKKEQKDCRRPEDSHRWYNRSQALKVDSVMAFRMWLSHASGIWPLVTVLAET